MTLVLYTVPECAEIMQMHVNTIRRYIKEGRINASRIGPGKRGHYRIEPCELEKLYKLGKLHNNEK